MLKRKVLLATLGLLAIAAAAIGVTVSSSASAQRGSPPVRSAAAGEADNHVAAMRSAFSVLNTTATTGGVTLPSGVTRAATTEGSGAGKAEPQLTARVVTGQYPIWVTPENGAICLVEENIVGPGIGSSICGTYEQALAGELIGLLGKYPTHGAESVVVGLAPDSNTSVLATDANGASGTVSVHENVYEIVGKAPHTITVRDANGQATTQEVPGT